MSFPQPVDPDELLLSLALGHGFIAADVAAALRAQKARDARLTFEAQLSQRIAPELLTQLRYEVRLSGPGEAAPSINPPAPLPPVPLPPPASAGLRRPAPAAPTPPPSSGLRRPAPVAPPPPSSGLSRLPPPPPGRGGMGVVWKARQTDLERTVAMKMLRYEIAATPNRRERFHSEARAAAKLQHPSIVAIHDVGEDEGIQFFTMDFVPGRTLAQLAKSGLEPARALEIAAALADAL
ncbi:protein kinase, partial [bacterium]|nr:protein kinase [bacterium]